MNTINFKSLTVIFTAILSFSAVSCSWNQPPPRTTPKDADLVFESYQAADAMLEQAPWLRDSRAPLLQASFVNVNDLEDSSALGRIIGDQVSSRLAQQGLTMIEIRMRNNIFIKRQAGEFTLSRELRNLARSYNATAVVAGTYAVGKRSVYVSARLIRTADNLVLAGYDYNLPLGPDTRSLARSNAWDSPSSSWMPSSQDAVVPAAATSTMSASDWYK